MFLTEDRIAWGSAAVTYTTSTSGASFTGVVYGCASLMCSLSGHLLAHHILGSYVSPLTM